MRILKDGCRLYGPEDGKVSAAGNWTGRMVICRDSGAKRITQSVNDYTHGSSRAVVNPNAEEVLYVANGEGACRINGFDYRLRSGTGVFIPPGAVYSIENSGPGTLRIIGACCPEDLQRRFIDPPLETASSEPPRLTVHENEREQIRAGADRVFRFLVHTDLGCRQVTQFVGWIPPGKAPFHFHTYEESIFILEGRGILHLEGQMSASEFDPDSSIYLPNGVLHCLENPGPSPIRLLGVFHPSGSPGAAYEDD